MEQTSTQLPSATVDLSRTPSNAIETVGINALSKIATMAIHAEMRRRCRLGINAQGESDGFRAG
jgi:hypothetical protein